MTEISVKTDKHDQFVDITDRVAEFVENSGVRDGAVLIYCPHTTAGIVINPSSLVKLQIFSFYNRLQFSWGDYKFVKRL